MPIGIVLLVSVDVLKTKGLLKKSEWKNVGLGKIFFWKNLNAEYNSRLTETKNCLNTQVK